MQHKRVNGMANDKTDQRQWFLRIATGTVFGPVPTKGLVVWAEQGRVVPGNEVSTDRESWVSADTVPELEMTWHVEDGAGKVVGPFNRIAAESFLKSGKAPPGARLVEARQLAQAAQSSRAEPPPPRPTAEPRSAPRPAAATPPAPVNPDPRPDEPDARDLRIRELEKDARARDRKLESLRQEIAKLQAAQTAATRPALTLIPEDAPADSDAVAQERLDEVRRAAEDERRCLEREIELLRARSQELQQSLASREAADAQSRDRHADLRAECETLRIAADAARQDADALRGQSAGLDARISELASLLGQRETECHKLSGECETLRQQLGIAMSAATDATNESDGPANELRRKVEQLQAVNEGLHAQLKQADQTLAEDRAEQAALLAAANERDQASQRRIEELTLARAHLESQLASSGAPGERETRLTAELAQMRARLADLHGRIARTPDAETAPAGPARGADPSDEWVRQFASDELASLDKILEGERAAFNTLRQLSSSRQETIQNRIQHLQRVLSGDGADFRPRPGARDRLAGLDVSRLQSEIDAMRISQQRETRQFEDREAELLRRIRVLETEDVRLRSQREASDMQGGRLRELMDTVRRREQELALERKNREQERQQLQSAQQALLKRIEELEAGAGLPGAARRDPHESRPADPTRRSSRLGAIGTWLHR